ncbi:AraC family transcriptional regulator [Defluviitalea phaphyphila]|uniref:AraC family transcriptional regulator n=1 Tax=Defluviitalea phaphyphila TaxID=1473580 RepID=UPI000AA3CB0C|nr:AraC family transcriptional regulator [Defluviitalea phaphyphila]
MLTNNFEIFHYQNTKLKEVKLHHHDFYELYFFISGDVTYYIEGKIFSLKPGDIILINSQELHQANINNKNITYDRIVLWMRKSFLKSLSDNKVDLTLCFESKNKNNILRVDFEIQQNIKLLLNKILHIQNTKGFGYELLYRAYITELMVYINNISLIKEMTTNVDINKNNLIDNIIEYINNHLEEDIKIDDLANYFYISKFHLSREFKKYTETTIHRYIVQKKLIRAKELILNRIPITEVYKKCGFGDYSNFFRAFKNEYGVTPKQFYKLMTK